MRPKALSGSIAKYSRGLALSVLTLIGASQAPGEIYYWDSNTTAGGFGSTTGVWGTSLFLNTDITGGAGGSFSTATTNADTLNFGTATLNYAQASVTVSGAVAASSIVYGAGQTTGITISGGTSITLGDGTSGNGGITLNNGTGAQKISTAITLNNTQTWTNNSANLFTVQTGALSLGSNALTIDGSGNTTITSIIGGTSGSILKTDAGTLTLSNGANTFTGGLTVRSGTVYGGGINNSANGSFGAGIITLGNTTGTSSATLSVGSTLTNQLSGSIPNAIVLATNSDVGALTIVNIGVNNSITITGGVTGTNNFFIQNQATGGGKINFATLPINNSGTVTNNATAAGDAGGSIIAGGIGSNVTGIIQDSTVHRLTIGQISGVGIGSIVVNPSVGTTLTNKSSGGSSVLTSSNNIYGIGNLILKNNSAITSGITISGGVNIVGTITNSGTSTGSTLISSNIGYTVTGVTQNSTGSALTLSAANDFSAPTTVTAGTLALTTNLALQNSPLDTTGAGVVTFTGATTPTIGGLNGSVDLATKFTTGYSLVTALTLKPVSGVTATYSGVISNGLPGGMSLTKSGSGTQILNGSAVNTFTGGLIINGGTLALDFANLGTPTDLLNNANTLGLSGRGALTIKGQAGAVSTSQTLGNFTLNAGGGTILINPNGGTGTTLNLGTLTTSATAGSLLVGTAAGAGSGTVAITTTTNKDAQNIYGGRVVFTTDGGSTANWATTSSGGSPYTLEAYSGYSALAASGTDTNNSRITASNTPGGSITTNSLKIEAPAASQSLVLGANLLTLTSGGLLATGTNAFTISGTAAATRLTAGNGSGAYDLVVHQYNTGGLTISAVIGNNGGNAVALTKAGPGTLTLSGTNTYTGQTYVNGGTLSISSNANLGDQATAATLNLNGATLRATQTLILGNGAIQTNPRPMVISNGATINTDAGTTLTTGGLISGTGGLTKTGAGTLAIGTTGGVSPTLSKHTFTGGLTVNGGALEVNFTQAYASGDSNYIASSNILTLGGASFTFRGPDTRTFTQNFLGLVLSSGDNSVLSTNSAGGSPGTHLILNGITRSGFSTLNASLGGATTSVQTTTVNTNGILGPWATFGTGTSTRYAVGASASAGTTTAITGLTGTTATDANAFASATANYEFTTTGTTTLTGNSTAYTARYAGTGGTIDLGSSGSNTLTLNGLLNAGTGTLTIQRSGTSTGTVVVEANTNELIVNAANSAANSAVTISAPITGGSGTALIKTGPGNLTLSADNTATFTGVTSLNAGTLALGHAGALGTGPLTINGGSLNSTVANLVNANDNVQTWNHNFTFTGTNSLDLGTGAVTITGYDRIVTVTANTLTVGGIIGDGGSGFALTKSGLGTLALNGVNTYTGATNVTGGILKIGTGGSTHASSAVGVSAGALGGTGTVGGAVTVSGTGGIDLRDGAATGATPLTLSSTLAITGAAGANNLYFDLGNTTGTSDQISVAGTTTVTTTGAAVINLNQLGGSAGRTATTYTLIGGAGTLDATNFAKFSLPTTKAFGQTYALTNISDDLQVVATNVTSATPAAFWSGATSGNWNTASNWKNAIAGSALLVVPDYQTNVTFSATGAGNPSNTLDADFDINSLTFTNASGNVTIGGTKMLTIEAAAVNGNTLGNGIDSQKITGTNTINAKVGVAASQTWTVARSGILAVSSLVTDFGSGSTVTLAGGGTLNLTNGSGTLSSFGLTVGDGTTFSGNGVGAIASANSQNALGSGAVTINYGGTLSTVTPAFNPTNAFTVNNGGTLNLLAAANTTPSGLITFNSGARLIANATTSTNLVLGANVSFPTAGALDLIAGDRSGAASTYSVAYPAFTGTLAIGGWGFGVANSGVLTTTGSTTVSGNTTLAFNHLMPGGLFFGGLSLNGNLTVAGGGLNVAIGSIPTSISTTLTNLGTITSSGSRDIIIAMSPLGIVSAAGSTGWTNTTINSGTFEVDTSANNIGSGTLTLNGGTLRLRNNSSSTKAITVGPNGGALEGVSFNGALGTYSGAVTSSTATSPLVIRSGTPAGTTTTFDLTSVNANFTGFNGNIILATASQATPILLGANALPSGSNTITVPAGMAFGGAAVKNGGSYSNNARFITSYDSIYVVTTASDLTPNLSSSGFDRDIAVGLNGTVFTGYTFPSSGPNTATYRIVPLSNTTTFSVANRFTGSSNNLSLEAAATITDKNSAVSRGYGSASNGTAASITFTASQDYGGATTITGAIPGILTVYPSGGRLILGAGGNLPNTTSITIDGRNFSSWTASLEIGGTTGQITKANLPITIKGGGILSIGDSTSANNNSVTNRITATSDITLGGDSGGGRLLMRYPAATFTHSQTLDVLNIAAGSSTIQGGGPVAGGDPQVVTGTANLTFAGGASYTRSTAGLVEFSLPTTTQTNTTTASGSNVLTTFTNAANVYVGAPISGTGIPGGSVVTSVGALTVRISQNATATGSVTTNYATTNFIPSFTAAPTTNTSAGTSGDAILIGATLTIPTGTNFSTDFVKAAIGAVVAPAYSINNTPSGWANDNILASGSINSTAISNTTINSLKLAPVTNTTVNITGGQTLTLGSGMLQFSASAALTGGLLTTSSSRDLILIGAGAFTLTINSQITGTNALVRSGSSTVVLNNASNAIGDIYLYSGTNTTNQTQITTSNLQGALGQTGTPRTIYFQGGVLNFANSVSQSYSDKSLNVGSANGTWTDGGTGASSSFGGSVTLNGILTLTGAGQKTVGGAITGKGYIESTSAGRLILSGNNDWSGGMNINGGGQVRLNSTNAAGTGPIVNGKDTFGGPALVEFTTSFGDTLTNDLIGQTALVGASAPETRAAGGFIISNAKTTAVTLSGKITTTGGLTFQGYDSGSAVSETVLSGTVATSGTQAFNYSYGNATTIQQFNNGQGGINLGVTGFAGNWSGGSSYSLTKLTSPLVYGESGFLAYNQGTTIGVTNGAEGYVRFDGANSFLPGAVGPGYVAALRKGGASTLNFGYFLTGSGSGTTYTLPEGKSFVIGTLGSGAGQTGTFGAAGTGTNTATFLGNPKAAAGQLLAGFNGGDINIHANAATDTATFNLSARNATDTLVLGDGVTAANNVVITPTWGDSGATSAMTLLQKRTGLTTLKKTGAGTLEIKGVNLTHTDGTNASGAFTWDVNVGTLKLNGTGVNTTILTDGLTATTSDITISGGTLELAASEQIANTGSINMTSGAFNFGAATGLTETIDKFTNSGGTFSTGANILIGLGNTVTWSGTSTNTVNNGGSVQDAHIVISDSTSTNTVQGGATGGVLQLNASGTGLEMSAGSTLTLNSDNAVAGKLLLKGNVSSSGDSTVTIASGLALTNKGNIDLDNGTRTFTVAEGAAATDMSISARITNGSIIKDGAGTLSLDAANTYSGTTAINGGTLIANVLQALPLSPRSAVSFTGGGNPTLSLGANQVAASLNSAGVGTTGTVTLGSSNLTVGAASGTTDFKGSIGGAGNLTKDDNSIQVLSGNNGYTGTTTVSGGTLEVKGSLSGTTAVTVNTGGTLLLNSAASPIIKDTATMTVGGGTVKIDNSLSNTNQTFGSLTLTGTSILDFGTGSSNAMTFSSLSFTGTKLNVYNWSGSAYGAGVADIGSLGDTQDRLLFTGTTSIGTSGDNRIEFFSDGGTTSLGFGQEVAFGSQFELVPITAVPEPATTALIGSIALCALIGYRERRRFTGFGKRTAARK